DSINGGHILISIPNLSHNSALHFLLDTSNKRVPAASEYSICSLPVSLYLKYSFGNTKLSTLENSSGSFFFTHNIIGKVNRSNAGFFVISSRRFLPTTS